jgi:acyl-CoA synthetase (AMP-forming)/AMP-acid ligase II
VVDGGEVAERLQEVRHAHHRERSQRPAAGARRRSGQAGGGEQRGGDGEAHREQRDRLGAVVVGDAGEDARGAERRRRHHDEGVAQGPRRRHSEGHMEDAAVFGVDDERWGQRVCVAVVGDIDPDGLLAYARTRLAPYKVPKTVYRVRELPRTGTGKVRRGRLADDLGLA